MAAPIRKKRNFKGLGLDVSQPPPPPPLAPLEPIRVAPAPGGKKRPPPMTLAAPKIGNNNAAATGVDGTILTVTGPNSAPPTAVTPSASRSAIHSTLTSTLASLDLNSEVRYQDLRNEDLKDLQELGQGNGGSVKKVQHLPTGALMAKKVCPAVCPVVKLLNVEFHIAMGLCGIDRAH